MNDDLEPRLRDALRSGSLPPAPASLVDALERVPDAPVRLRRRRGAAPILGLFAAAAVLLVASAVALTTGSAPGPAPSARTPAPSAAGVPRLHLEYTAQTVDGVAPTPADMAKVTSVLRSRIEATGVADPTVTTHDMVVVVELPGVIDPADVETVGRMLGHTGKVDFVPLGETAATEGDPIDLAKNPPLFGGDQIASATVGTDQNGAPAVDFVLKPDGTRLFADYTANHIGSYFAITIDGDVLSAPVIQNAIPNGDIEITGGGVSGLDATHAHGLVALIASGALPVPVALTSSEVLGLASADPSGAASSPDPSVDASPGPSRLHLEFVPVVTDGLTVDLMVKVVDKLSARIADAGVVGATVEVGGSDRIIVELPGVASSDDPLVDMLPRTGHVSLIELRDGQDSIAVPIDPTVNPTVLPENAVDWITEDVGQAGVAAFVLHLSPDPATTFVGYAPKHVGSSYAIAIDGSVLLAPVTLRKLKDAVLTVTADATVVDRSDARVRAILAILQTGPLPFDLKAVSTEVVPEPKSTAP